MKKSILIVFVISFTFFSSFALTHQTEGDFGPEAYTYAYFEYYFSWSSITKHVTDKGTFKELFLENATMNGFNEIGKPRLPFYIAQIVVPSGKYISNIIVNATLYNTTNWNHYLYPEQRQYNYSYPPEIIVTDFNETFYRINETVFSENYIKQNEQYSRGYTIQLITLYPINYNPYQNKSWFYNHFNITIKYSDFPTESKGFHPFFRNLESDANHIKSIVDNPNTVDTYHPSGFNIQDFQTASYPGGICDDSATCKYVIITNRSLNDTTGYTYNWSDLMNHRNTTNDLSCCKIAWQDINETSAYWNTTAIYNDSQARIREFCKDAYQDWETEYILLGGDWDATVANQIVPYRLFTDRWEGDTYDTMACDKYFSHLDTTWRYFSYWGGGKGGVYDLYGELYVGRITVSTGEHISNSIHKIINYDTNESLFDNWLNHSSFWGGDLGWTSTSKQFMEELRLGTDTYRTFTGFEEWNTAHQDTTINTTDRLYHADIGESYKSAFVADIENDNSSIVNHMDHSSWNTPFGLPNWYFRINTKPFFGYTQGCLAGRFNSGFAGCEQMMCRHEERHAFALCLNTGYGYGATSSTNGASQYIQAFFWDYMFNNQSDHPENWQLGKAAIYASDKMGIVVESKSWWWTYAWYSAHFFGDPAQVLKITNETQDESTAPEFISIDGTTNGTLVTTSTPTFNWTSITNTSQYQLQISNVNDFSVILLNILDINEIMYPTYYDENATRISFTLPSEHSLPSPQRYYCRVRANYLGDT